jgi:pentatricopeptide repeat protein
MPAIKLLTEIHEHIHELSPRRFGKLSREREMDKGRRMLERMKAEKKVSPDSTTGPDG